MLPQREFVSGAAAGGCTEQRKHSMWYALSRARITRSLLLKLPGTWRT